MNNLIAGGVALAVMAGAYQVIFAKGEIKGAETERARVQSAEKKVNEKVKAAQRAAAGKPAASVLERWQTD